MLAQVLAEPPTQTTIQPKTGIYCLKCWLIPYLRQHLSQQTDKSPDKKPHMSGKMSVGQHRVPHPHHLSPPQKPRTPRTCYGTPFLVDFGKMTYLFVILQCSESDFTGSDLYYVLDVVYEDLTVTDMTGVEGLLSCLDYLFDRYCRYYDVYADLRQE